MQLIYSTIFYVTYVLFDTVTRGQVIDSNFCVDHGFETGLFPHPDPQKCNSFVLCAMFIPIPQVCPVGKIFVADLGSNPPYGACELGKLRLSLVKDCVKSEEREAKGGASGSNSSKISHKGALLRLCGLS